MNIRRINPNISSDNLEKSRIFYTDFIGLKLVMDMEWIMTFASVSNPTAQISIQQKDITQNTEGDFSITVEVENIDEVYAKAISLGQKIVYPITNEPWGVRRFFVVDPNGIVVNIMCHIKHQ